jgi:hypothetical protein
MRRWSESLVELAARAEELDDSAADALEGDRSTLELRRREIELGMAATVEALDAAARDVSPCGRTLWDDASACVTRQLDSMRAERTATTAERNAAAAVAFARYCLDVAEYAVVDAELALGREA